MNKNVRKSLALFIAGIMIVTGIAFTSDNVLKAADPDAAATEQTVDGAEGTADNATAEQPEVKDESASLGTDTSGTATEQKGPEIGNDQGGSMVSEIHYTVGVNQTVKINDSGNGTTVRWYSVLPYYATVDSNGVVTGKHISGVVPVTIIREYKYGFITKTEEFAVWVTASSKVSLTINYVDEKGTKLIASYEESYDKGASYSVPSPEIDGYVADKTTVAGTISENTEINVVYKKDKTPRYNCYVYGLIPGYTVGSSESNDRKWEGLGVVEIYNVPEPHDSGIRPEDYKFGKVVKALYPDLVFDGKTYKYAANGSAEAETEGYYTLTLVNVSTASGANSGHNGYNPYVHNGTFTYHADYVISLVTKTSVYVNFAVAEPGSSTYTALQRYAQKFDKNVSESSISKPGKNDVPATKVVDGTTYYFDGWYKDEACTQKANFDGRLTANQTYYGRYIAHPTAQVKYLPGDHGTFEEQVYAAPLNESTPEFRGEPTGEAGYEFAGWSPSVASKVTGAATYTATWKAKNDTPYKVAYFYEKNGAYSETPDSIDESRKGTTGEIISVTDEDKTPSENNYVFDEAASVVSGTLAGDGSLVLKVFFKEQFQVTYKPGTQGTFAEAKTIGIAYGSATPEAPDAANNHKPGYTFGGWTPAVESTVTKNATYVAQWIADESTPYTVEYYYAVNGQYGSTADDSVSRGGTTGTEVAVTNKDKTTAKAGYTFDSNASGNILAGTVAGDGTLTLKVYFKEQFQVTYKPGAQGTFEDKVTGELDYDSATPAGPNASKQHNPGYTFAGWTPDVAEKVTANAEYTATWTANTDTAYKVEYYYEKNGQYGAEADSSDDRTGTTAEMAEVTEADKTPSKSGYIFDSAAPGNALAGTIAGDGSLVLKVYFKQQFKVTYKPGTQGTFADKETSGLSYGDAVPEAPAVATEHNPGYTFTGWSPEVTSQVTGNAVYIAQWKANEDTAYTVEYYYEKNGAYSKTPDSKDQTRAATTGATVAATDEDKIPLKKGYIFDAASSTASGTVSGSGSFALKIYFKQQFQVTYKPGEQGTFDEASTGNLAYGAATPAAPDAANAHKAGYTFAGWTPEVAESVTANAEYTATWTANTDTPYTVEFYYEKNGKYSDTADSSVQRVGTTAETVSVTDDDKAVSSGAYALDTKASKFSGKVAGDGSLVLKVCFKEQFTVSYTAGEYGTFQTQTTSDIDYNAATPEFTGQKTGADGYEFTGWTPTVADKVTSNVEYVAQWKAKSGISYTVEYYYAENGSYSDKASSSVQRSGVTGETANATEADKTPVSAGYVLDESAANVLSATIKGNGTTTLKVYFKEQFQVTYKPGAQGTFEEVSTGSLDYNAATPEAPDAAGNHKPGYTFDGWDPAVADKVTGNAEYTAKWIANEDTKYTVNYYGYDGDGGWNVLESKKLRGTTGETAEANIKGYEGYSFYDGYAGNVLEGTIAGDGSLVLNVYYRVTVTVSITGHTEKLKYNGLEQTVEGYELSSSTTAVVPSAPGFNKASGITYDTDNVAENASITKVAKGRDAGTYEMGLTEDMFRNTEDGFDVTFVVASDGQMEISPRIVVLTSASATKEFDGTPLTKDEISVSGDGFIEGEGFGYLFTGSQTEVGKSDNTFKYEITMEHQNTNPDNYVVSVEYGTLEVTEAKIIPANTPGDGPTGRKITNQIKAGQGYTTIEIADGKTPHGNNMLDTECCILHLILMLAALAVALGYTKDMKDRQAKIHEYEEALAKAGINM